MLLSSESRETAKTFISKASAPLADASFISVNISLISKKVGRISVQVEILYCEVPLSD